MKRKKTPSSLITRNGHKMNALTLDEGGYNIKLEKSDGSTQYVHNIKLPFYYINQTVTNLLLSGSVNITRATVTGTGELIYENGRFSNKFDK